MSILLNGRTIEVILKANTGVPDDPGTELDISPYLLTLGTLSWSVDEQLTKLSLGNLSLTVRDDYPTSTVWSFIDSSLSSSSGILPPWIFLNVDGTQRFIGLVKEAPTRNQDSGTLEIAINAVDWSTMLESKRIQADDKAFDRRFTFRDGTGYASTSPINCYSVNNKELRRGHDRTTVKIDMSQSANFTVGDWVYFSNYSTFSSFNAKYQIIGIQILDMVYLTLGGSFWWKENPGDPQSYGQQSTLYKLISTTSNLVSDSSSLPIFLANENYTPDTTGTNAKTSIVLTYIDGLRPGDVLDKVSNPLLIGDTAFSVNIVDIDPGSNTIYVDSPISNILVSGITTFQLNAVSLAESVLIPIIPLIQKAIGGLATLDYSQYSPATLPSPCFSFVSPASPVTQTAHSETISGISDMQPGLVSLQVKGTAGKGWVGLPGVGWDSSTWSKMISWTDQTTTAPAYLMPWVTPTDLSQAYDRTRTTYAGLTGGRGDRTKDSSADNGVTQKTVYDYSNFRYYEFNYSNSLHDVVVKTYNGSSWSVVSGFTITGVGTFLDAVPFKDATTSNGSGYGLLALYSDGTVKTIYSTVSLTATLSGEDVRDTNGFVRVQLKQTPNGVYYLTPSGYGQIWISGGVLKTKWVKLYNQSDDNKKLMTITPLTSTFTYANGRIITLAKVSYKKSISDARFIDDTYLFQLAASIPNNAQDAVLSKDFIVSSLPRTTMAVKSPISEDVIGFMGGRMFVISKTLPDTIERFNPTNQTANSIIEFACAMTNSVAIPLVSGNLKMVSRGYNNTPTNLTVDIKSQTDSRWNKHLADCIVISGASGSEKGIAVSETQLSGITISYSNDVYIRNSSQAQAIAESYLAFFEKPRREMQQEWFSATLPAPWEAIQPMSIVTINGGTTQYYLTALEHDLEQQTARATLLEVV